MNKAETVLLEYLAALGQSQVDAAAATMGFQLACGIARLEPEWWAKRRDELEGDRPVPAVFARMVRDGVERKL